MNRKSSALLLVVLALFSFALTSCVGKSKYDAQIEELMAFKDSVEQAQKVQNSNSAANNSESSQTGYNETNSEESSRSVSASSSSDFDTSSGSSHNEASYVGTYELTDYADNVWEIVLNSDETCTMGVKGHESVAYGSWDLTNYLDYTPGLEFSDDKPLVVFPSGTTERIFLPHIVDGYFYVNGSAAQAKNPKKRLPIKKVR